jgi:ATP-binding cassette subfamily B protein/subfamily B ATP-binding cassette protein MsbA
VLIFMIDAWVDVQLTMRWVRVGQGAVYRLGRAVFGRLLRRSPVFHVRTPVGDSVGRVTGDSWCVYNAASALLFAPMQALLVGVGSAVVMVRLNAWLAAIALVSTPAVVWLSLWLGRRAQEAKGAERRSEARLESHVHQTFAGLSVVQAFAQEQREQAKFGALTSETLAAQRRSALLGATAGAGAGLIASVAMAGVLLLGSREVLAGRLTVGTLLVFIAYQTTLNGQLSSLASAWMAAKGMTASASRVGEVLVREPEVTSGQGDVPLTEAGVAVELEGVSFAYEPGRPVLDNFSLLVAPGETIAIVGPSGAGKSTLAMLIARLIDPSQGVVRIGGVDAREATLESVRSRVSVLFQDPALLAGTVAENIRLGKPGATDAEVEHAARSAGAHEFIMRLPEKYRAELGMRGMTLSGGERQRLALARALIRQSPVLVLDEPTASLDAATEQALLATLERAAQGRTTFIIAHRLSTIRAADRIAVMDQGRIQELGTHEELLARSGLYARMWALQHGGVPVGGGA